MENTIKISCSINKADLNPSKLNPYQDVDVEAEKNKTYDKFALFKYVELQDSSIKNLSDKEKAQFILSSVVVSDEGELLEDRYEIINHIKEKCCHLFRCMCKKNPPCIYRCFKESFESPVLRAKIAWDNCINSGIESIQKSIDERILKEITKKYESK